MRAHRYAIQIGGRTSFQGSYHRAAQWRARPKTSKKQRRTPVLTLPPPLATPVWTPINSSIRDMVPLSMITVSTSMTNTVARRASLFGSVKPAAPTAPHKPAQMNIIWYECGSSSCLCPCQRCIAFDHLREGEYCCVAGRPDSED